MEQYKEEPLMAASAMIASLNRSAEARHDCLDTIQKYLSNIMDNPGEEKYRKIRRANKTFAQKVAGCRGAVEFLKAIGFQEKDLPGPDGFQDQFLVMDKPDMDRLAQGIDCLVSVEPIPVHLDRNAKVLKPGQPVGDVLLPAEFYERTADEIKREQMAKQEEVISRFFLSITNTRYFFNPMYILPVCLNILYDLWLVYMLGCLTTVLLLCALCYTAS